MTPSKIPHRVLVAEDDRSVREAVERALRFEGFEVATVRDGSEALQALLNDTPDVIILDVMMPHIDGLDVARRVRARGDTTPILMLTARHEVSDRVAGLDAGADDYLVKPFALEELLARLRALLRRTTTPAGVVYRVGVVLSRDQIYEHVWGYDFATSSNSLDVYIGYLRRKTEVDGASRLIHTVRGVGYVARAET
jgi:two-component system response regulator MprA